MSANAASTSAWLLATIATSFTAVLESVAGIFQQATEPMECQQRVLDVFVTNADDNQEEEFDDQFVCAVQSVTLITEKLEVASALITDQSGSAVVVDPNRVLTTAVIVAEESDWILPLWPMTGDSQGDGDMFKDIEVGDLIRIGGPSTHGFTDYLTVVEKVQVSLLASTEQKIRISKDEADDILDYKHDGNTSSKIEYRKLAKAVFALRLNHSIDATTLPTILDKEQQKNKNYDETVAESKEFTEPNHFTQKAARSLQYRHSRRLWGGTTGEEGGYYFPMYHMKEWRANNSQMTARLDHGVKEVKQIKLMGYSLINKRQVGPQHAHEMVQDDYLILRIKEVTGQLISNNRHANGAFAVLYSGSHGQNTKGGVDVHTYETDGLVVQNLTATNSVMRNLTLQLTDRTGKPAHFGRLHLWFKITATHG